MSDKYDKAVNILTDSEMRKMQQEAVRRAQEMQSRARAVTQQISDQSRPRAEGVRQSPAQAEPATAAAGAGYRSPPMPPEYPRRRPTAESSFASEQTEGEKHRRRTSESPDIHNDTHGGGVFEVLLRDKEKTLILSLILLLMDENTDNSLVLALLYLLM